MYLGLLTLIQQEVISNETVLRYLTGHPVSQITVAMFFVGLASLLAIGINVLGQFQTEKQIRLDELEFDENDSTQAWDNTDLHADADSDNVVVTRSVEMGRSMLALPRSIHEHYLWQRIVNALLSIYRTGSTASVEDELKYLADIDNDRQQQRYSLVRILIWATPMLGFLGTVLGISQALGSINVGPENDFQQMMNGLRDSLYVAFDTTALALTLSMILMFGQFLVDRFETQLLQLVDQLARGEIAKHFDLSAPSEPAWQQDINDKVVAAIGSSVEHQTEIWRETIQAAEQAWASTITDMSGQVQDKLSTALNESVGDLSHCLGEAIEKADDSMARRWEQWQVTLSQNARLMESQQHHLCEQTRLTQDLLNQTVEAEKQTKNDSDTTEQPENSESIDLETELSDDSHDLAEIILPFKTPELAQTQVSPEVSDSPSESIIPIRRKSA